MSMRYKGSRLSATANTPTSLTASGAWTLQQQMQANGTSTWPFVRDPQFNYVTMLLHGDGSAGANNGSGGGVTPTVTNFNADASTNNFNVTINGDARSDNFTPYQGNGYYGNYFDGSGDYLSFANNTNLNLGSGDFTIECWFYHLTGTGNGIIWSQWNNGGDNSGQLLTNGTGLIYRIGATQWTFGTFVANTWNHLAVSRSGSTVTMFLNGVVARTETNSTNITTTGATVIGANDTGTTPANFFNGYISNFRQVKGTAVYTSAFTPPTTPLTAITNTQLLTCQSNRFIDNSTNAFTVTVNGNTAVSPAQPFTLPSSVATYGSGYFDGTGDYLNTPSTGQFAPSGDFTISCWYYPTSTRTYQQVLGNFNASASTVWIIEVTSGTGISFYTNGTTVRISGSGVVLNAWNYLVLARSGSTITGYVNGVSVGTYSQSGTLGSATQPISVGRGGSSSAAGDISLGYIADVKLIDGSAVTTIPITPQTATTGTQLLTTQYNGGGNNNGFKDSSQNNFTITRNGNTTQGTFTPYGSNWSNFFDGNADTLYTASSSAFAMPGDFTMECWAFPLVQTQNYPLLFHFNSSSTAIQYDHDDAPNKFSFVVNDVRIAPSATQSPNAWYHIAGVRSGSTCTLYINGVSVATMTNSASLATSAVYIGGNEAVSSQLAYLGYISNVRVVKGTAVYTSNFTPSTTPLTAISGTSLLTCQSNRFVDNSSNAFALTTTSTPSVQRFSPFANATAYNPATLGGSAYFDGSGDYLSVASNAAFGYGTGDFTYECWFYLNALPSSGAGAYLLDQRTTAVQSVPAVYIYSDATIVLYVSGGVVASGGSVVINTWNNFVLSRASGTTKMFLNGSQIGSNYTDSNNYIASPVYIGARFNGVDVVNGYISNARIVKGTALYTSAFTPSTAPLTPTANTQLLLSTTNSAIFDNAMMNDLETVGVAQISTSVVKYGTGSISFGSVVGNDNYLLAPATPNLEFGSGDFTIEFWWYPISTARQALYHGSFGVDWSIGIDYSSVSTNQKIGIWASSNGTSWNLINADPSGNGIGTTTLTQNAWNHIAFVRNGTTWMLFVNGNRDLNLTSISGSIVDRSTYRKGINVWWAPSAGVNEASGYMDDFRITKGYARYTATFTPPTQALPNG